MNIIDCHGSITFNRTIEAYNHGVRGNIEPTQMYMGEAIWNSLQNKFRVDQRPVMRFMNAQIFLAEDIEGAIWFRNPAYPMFDVVLINIKA